MAKFCVKCGTTLPDNASFCKNCGAKQPDISTFRPQQPSQQQVQQPLQHPVQSVQPQQSKQPEKKKSGGFKKFVALVIVATLLITGFYKPGFVLKWLEPGEPDPPLTPPEVSVSISVPEKKEPKEIDSEQAKQYDGNSKALSFSPCEGVYVTAEKNAFAQDTDIKIEPVTEADTQLVAVADSLEEEGKLAIAAFHVDAGLEDDEVIPGVYTVSYDLQKLDIPESFWPYLSAYRVADDGTYYQYNADVLDGKLVYDSDQNSVCAIVVDIAIWTVVACLIVYYGKQAYEAQIVEPYQKPFKYFYDKKKKISHLECKNKYMTYTIFWNMEDLDKDAKEKQDRLEEIAKDYQARSQQLYKEYEENRHFDASNILQIFSRSKSVAEVVLEAIQKDEEYQKLQNELKVPDSVAYCIRCVDLACEYLKSQYVKMPTGVVEIISKPAAAGALANATNRSFDEGYIEVNLTGLDQAEQTVKDNFLITMTHEMLHICQAHYRYFWADSPRFDEMVAVYMEPDALLHFHANGAIDWDSNPPLSLSDYWGTMKLPVDKYYADDGGEVMKNEGYNLALFLTYLEEKLGKTLWIDRIMRCRSSRKEGGISEPLKKLFDINDEELSTHYRVFLHKYKDRMATHYDSYAPETYKRNAEIKIEKGGRYHVNVTPEGGYAAEIRGFAQTTNEDCTLVLVPDPKFAEQQPECDLVPIDKFEAISKGLLIYPKESKGTPNRDILEIHGALNGASLDRNTGYTIYPLAKTKKVTISEDNRGDVVIKLPENSYAGDDGIIDGYIMKIEGDNDFKSSWDIGPDLFETDITIPRDDIYKDTDPSESVTITVTLCEYIKKNATDTFMSEESDPVYFALGERPVDVTVYSNLKITKDTLSGYEYRERQDDDEVKYTSDPVPSNNSITIKGDTVIFQLGELDWSYHAQDKKYERIKANTSYHRDSFTITGQILYRYDTQIYAQVTDFPAVITGSLQADGVSAEFAGEEVTYYTLTGSKENRLKYIDPYYDSLSPGGTMMSLSFEDGKLVSAYLSLLGTAFYDESASSSEGESRNDSGDMQFSEKITLEP